MVEEDELAAKMMGRCPKTQNIRLRRSGKHILHVHVSLQGIADGCYQETAEFHLCHISENDLRIQNMEIMQRTWLCGIVCPMSTANV